MKSRSAISLVFCLLIAMSSCKKQEEKSDMNIIFLHHSTGSILWNGATASLFWKALGKLNGKPAILPNARLPRLVENHNEKNNTNYNIEEMVFPKAEPYGWANFPFDYYNIWVKNAGEEPYMEEPTLELLTRDYQVIIFKHCYPVSNIREDQDSADIDSRYMSMANYKLQYAALREKLREFPDTKFILFTGAAQVKANVSEDKALRAREFFDWVTGEWDVPGDNIFIWDLYHLQTEGELYLKEKYAASPENSHPNDFFAGKSVDLLFNRIIDVVENNGQGTSLKGEKK